MADGAHVGLVDAHAEGVRRDDDGEPAVHEPALDLAALLAPEPGVVDADRAVEVARQVPGELLGAVAGAGVDDRGRRPGLRQRGRDVAVLGLRRRARDDAEGEVRAVEAGRDADRVAQPEPERDVAGDLRRRGRRRGDDRVGLQPARGIREAEVVGPEVVAPLRDAVRLVDDEQPDLRVAHRVQERRRGEALGRDVEQAQLARCRGLQRRAVVGAVALGVDERDAAGRDRLAAPRPGPA